MTQFCPFAAPQDHEQPSSAKPSESRSSSSSNSNTTPEGKIKDRLNSFFLFSVLRSLLSSAFCKRSFVPCGQFGGRTVVVVFPFPPTDPCVQLTLLLLFRFPLGVSVYSTVQRTSPVQSGRLRVLRSVVAVLLFFSVLRVYSRNQKITFINTLQSRLSALPWRLLFCSIESKVKCLIYSLSGEVVGPRG